MGEGMKANHEKRMREAFERAWDKILNNFSTGGTNDAVPDLSTTSLLSELFDENRTGMKGIYCKDKDVEEEKMRRSMREEVTKIVG